jgi:hypothetical protein
MAWIGHKLGVVLTTNQVIAVAGVATFVVTAAAILVTLKGVRDQLWLQTFSEWTRRYLDYVCKLPAAARNPDGSFSLDTLDTQERDDLMNAFRMYVNLSSEEHYLHSRGNIDRETWRIWTLGMEDAFRAAWFRDTWLQIRHEYSAYEEFRTFFDAFEAAADEATDAVAQPPAAEVAAVD